MLFFVYTAIKFTLEVNYRIDYSIGLCYYEFTSKVNLKRGGCLEITYKTKKIERICTDAKTAEKTYGRKMAEKIQQRMQEIQSVDNVEIMVKYHIGRCHPLKNNRKGQYAVDLVHPYRMIFNIIGDEIQIVRILEIVDYH